MFPKVWELERFQTAKVNFKVIQGHWQWSHSIGHIQFPIKIRRSIINLSTKFEVSNSIHYEDMKGLTKYRKWGGLGS